MANATFRFISIGVTLLFLVVGCSQDSLTSANYIRYVKDPKNGFIEKQNLPSGAFVEALYEPPEYVALAQLRNKRTVDSILIAAIDQNSEFYHFFLTIGSESGVPIDELLKKTMGGTFSFEERKQQMLYKAQGCFSLLVNGGSLPCIFYHTQLSGQLANAYHFIVAFEVDPAYERLNQRNDLTLIFNDSIWFQKKFEFTFDRNRINQSPRLKI